MPGCSKEHPPYPDTPRLTLVRTPAPVTSQASPGQWSMLMARAQGRIIDQLRRQTRRRSRETELSAEHETFAAPPTKLFGDNSVELALVGAIDKLPPDQRDAIKMMKLKEMSLKEASQASGRSVSALKVATHRAIKNLRKLLKGELS
jgi:RNA polymerase sigma-70 factor, ECF subfamily